MNQHTQRPADPQEITELRGTFDDGYTPDDINRVFGLFQDVYGRTLVCRWEAYDDEGYSGNSEFYFEEGGTYYYDAGVYGWLNGRRDTPLGDPAQWRGAPVPETDTEGPQHAVIADGLHNCALVDENKG